MKKLCKRLPLCESLSGNLRGFTKYKDGFAATAFPHQKLYLLNKDLHITKEIETEKFYGSLFYCEEKDQLLCGCYSSLCCELHVLAPDGSVEERIDTYQNIPKENKDKEHFPSFCTAVFCLERNYYFSLQNSSELYCFDWQGNFVTTVDYQVFFEKPTVLLSVTAKNKKIYSLVTVDNKVYLVISTPDQKQLSVHPIHDFEETDIYAVTLKEKDVLAAVGKIKESYVVELYTLK